MRLCGGARGGDEGAQLGGVLLARRLFDAGDDIDSAGVEEADGVGDVGGGEASGDDDRDVLLDALDDGECGLPVEGDASASAGLRRSRIEQDAVVALMQGEVGVELAWVGKQLARLQRLDELAQTEGAPELGQLLRRLVAVQLQTGEADGFGEVLQRVRRFVDDDADFFD